jgi:hypothetical protein
VQSKVKESITRAQEVGQELEDLIVKRGQFLVDSDRTLLIVGYWSLVFDYHKSILCLIENEFYGGAFALLRPMVEGLLRAHVAISCRPGVIKSLQTDKYSVDFKQLGPQLDQKFRLGGLFERLLKTAAKTLHSFTHSGTSQLSHRFDGNDVTPRFSGAELIEVITSVTAMAFMVTALTTKHLGFEQEWKAANDIYRDKAKHLSKPH